MNPIRKNFSKYLVTELGPLPEDWEVVRLEEVFEETKVRVKDCKNETEIPILSITRHDGLILQSQKFEKRIASNNIANYKVIHRGEMVYGFPMDEGVIYFLWNFEKGAVSPVYYTWRLIRKADPYYLDYALKSPIMMSQYEKCMTRTVHRRRIVKPQDFISLKIPLPPLPEQKAIAGVLKTIQDAIEATEGVIAATRELKKSLMRHLFTYGPVPVSERDRVRLKQTEIGPIPEDWEMVRLGEVIDKTQYGLSKRGHTTGYVPILRMNNIVEGKIDTASLQFVDLTDQELKKFRLNKGDILFNRTNSLEWVGKTAIFDLEGTYVFASYLIRLKINLQKADPFFVNAFMNWSETQKRLKAIASRGVSQSNISATKLKNFYIPLPPLPVQQKIAQILKAVDDKIEAEEKKKEALQAFFKTMLHHLMTGKIRVKT